MEARDAPNPADADNSNTGSLCSAGALRYATDVPWNPSASSLAMNSPTDPSYEFFAAHAPVKSSSTRAIPSRRSNACTSCRVAMRSA